MTMRIAIVAAALLLVDRAPTRYAAWSARNAIGAWPSHEPIAIPMR